MGTAWTASLPCPLPPPFLLPRGASVLPREKRLTTGQQVKSRFLGGIFTHVLALSLLLISSVTLRRDQFFEPGSPHLKREVRGDIRSVNTGEPNKHICRNHPAFR